MYIWYHLVMTPATKNPKRKDIGMFVFMLSQNLTISSKVLKQHTNDLFYRKRYCCKQWVLAVHVTLKDNMKSLSLVQRGVRRDIPSAADERPSLSSIPTMTLSSQQLMAACLISF